MIKRLAIILLILGITILILAIGLTVWLFQTGTKTVSQEPEIPTAGSLYVSGAESTLARTFQKAYSLEASGNYEDAVAEYKNTLASAQNSAIKAHIKYRIARTYESIDPVHAVELYKEIVADDSYPDIQKTYSLMWMALLIGNTGNEDVRNAVLSGEPYSTFADKDLLTVYKNIFEFSLQFGSNGIGEFVVAQWYANDLAKNSTQFSSTEREARLLQIKNLLSNGDLYIQNNRSDIVNQYLIPNVLRWKARAYAALAIAGDSSARNSYSEYYEEAIDATLLSHLDGAVRFGYFKYAYDIEGVDSFAKTQKHLDVLLNNIDSYPEMATYFKQERDNFYNGKVGLVKIANDNPTLKDYLLSQAGWTESDFEYRESQNSPTL